ncbi:hypothetical protein B566_EDAN009542 [Ephemera danica]|nr:hypothetical protein B566_EDAN009542 [Ephemera danica]
MRNAAAPNDSGGGNQNDVIARSVADITGAVILCADRWKKSFHPLLRVYLDVCKPCEFAETALGQAAEMVGQAAAQRNELNLAPDRTMLLRKPARNITEILLRAWGDWNPPVYHANHVN